jgi:hypothetical protein
MTIFAILLPTPNPRLAEAIERNYPGDWLSLNETQFLVSSSGTAMQVSAKIGIADPNDRQKPPIGTAVVFATTAYYGRAPTPVWDWVKAKLESPPDG